MDEVGNNNELAFAYLAGVLDSDGSISINCRRGVQRDGYSAVYSEAVAISQTKTEALYLAQSLFGGTVRLVKRGIGSNKPNSMQPRRPMYTWYVADRIAVATLRAVLPYLRVKRKQADIVLKLRELKERGKEINQELTEPYLRLGRWGWRMNRTRRLRSEVLDEYSSLATAVRALNTTNYPNADRRLGQENNWKRDTGIPK